MAPKTAGGLIEVAAARLAALPNPRLDAEFLFRGITGWSRAEVLVRGDEPLSVDLATAFGSAVERRTRHEPVQYILGRAAFWRDEFLVTPAVLIPRPDTETLVEAVAMRMKPVVAPYLLDVGTGSGCIALSLLRELEDARALALDVSEAALAVSRENTRLLGLESRIQFARSHWLEAVPQDARFEAIVSNPPYVARGDGPTLPTEVREFEPALALYAEESDDLSSYRAIVSEIGPRLKPTGLLAFEVGIGQAERVAQLLSKADFRTVEIVVDLAGVPRVVLGSRP